MTSRLKLAAAFVALLGSTAPVLAGDGIAGPYLAGRQAVAANDFGEAARYLSEALAHDPGDLLLAENLLLALVSLGDVGRAVPVAKQLRGDGQDSQTVQIVLLADQLQRRAWDEIRADQDSGREISPLIDGLARAWTRLGQGLMSEALEEFDALAEVEGLGPFARYHKALALASVGDFEAAEALLSAEASGGLGLTRRGLQAHVEVLSQLDRHEDALTLIDAVLDSGPDPVIEALRAKVEQGEPLPFTMVRGPAEGVAEAFFTVAMALGGEGTENVMLAYARIAEHIRPGHVDATLLAAGLLESLGQYDLATATYNSVPADNPAFDAAELGRAQALHRSGRVDAATEVLEQLARRRPDLAIVHVTLGDMLRGEEDYAAAIQAYDRAVALFDEPAEQQWAVYYTRGIALEREKRWPEAEADFRRALELQPDQPLVLNYLGYSYVERKENLDEALEMIERAAAARPEDGYITDSLGWVLYRLGRYDEAVGPMERAAELAATDPVINDHLGDVYWAVGRKLEARFQWRRALSFGPEPEDEQRIRRKLDLGLDAVLAEEGAAPLRVTANGH